MSDEDKEGIRERQFFAINKALGKVIDSMGLVPAEVTWRFIRTVADMTADKEIIDKMLIHYEVTRQAKERMETQVGYVQADNFSKSQRIEFYLIQRNEELLRMIMLLCAEKGISITGFNLGTGVQKSE